MKVWQYRNTGMMYGRYGVPDSQRYIPLEHRAHQLRYSCSVQDDHHKSSTYMFMYSAYDGHLKCTGQ